MNIQIWLLSEKSSRSARLSLQLLTLSCEKKAAVVTRQQVRLDQEKYNNMYHEEEIEEFSSVECGSHCLSILYVHRPVES